MLFTVFHVVAGGRRRYGKMYFLLMLRSERSLSCGKGIIVTDAYGRSFHEVRFFSSNELLRVKRNCFHENHRLFKGFFGNNIRIVIDHPATNA